MIVLGAVAYDPKVVTIWEGFRRWLRARDCEFDFVLYSHYERLVEELVAGRVDVAWNSPLAWVRSRRLSPGVRAVAMRDTDRDLTTVIVVRADSGLSVVEDLRGRTVGTGAVDSPQATLLPLSLLRQAGVGVRVRRFDIGVGLHGDHIGGERDAAVALREGRVDAACVTDTNLLLFAQEGTLASGSVRVVAQTEPYDHCVLTTGPGVQAEQLVDLLLGMSYSDPEARPLLDLEGLTRWLPGRTERHAGLEKAVDESGFYDREGHIGAGDYRP